MDKDLIKQLSLSELDIGRMMRKINSDYDKVGKRIGFKQLFQFYVMSEEQHFEDYLNNRSKLTPFEPMCCDFLLARS